MAWSSDFLQRKSVAVHLGISVRTLERMHRADDAPPRIRVGGQWRYPRVSLAKWSEDRKMRQDATSHDSTRQLDEVA